MSGIHKVLSIPSTARPLVCYDGHNLYWKDSTIDDDLLPGLADCFGLASIAVIGPPNPSNTALADGLIEQLMDNWHNQRSKAEGGGDVEMIDVARTETETSDEQICDAVWVTVPPFRIRARNNDPIVGVIFLCVFCPSASPEAYEKLMDAAYYLATVQILSRAQSQVDWWPSGGSGNSQSIRLLHMFPPSTDDGISWRVSGVKKFVEADPLGTVLQQPGKLLDAILSSVLFLPAPPAFPLIAPLFLRKAVFLSVQMVQTHYSSVHSPAQEGRVEPINDFLTPAIAQEMEERYLRGMTEFYKTAVWPCFSNNALQMAHDAIVREQFGREPTEEPFPTLLTRLREFENIIRSLLYKSCQKAVIHFTAEQHRLFLISLQSEERQPEGSQWLSFHFSQVYLDQWIDAENQLEGNIPILEALPPGIVLKSHEKTTRSDAQKRKLRELIERVLNDRLTGLKLQMYTIASALSALEHETQREMNLEDRRNPDMRLLYLHGPQWSAKEFIAADAADRALGKLDQELKNASPPHVIQEPRETYRGILMRVTGAFNLLGPFRSSAPWRSFAVEEWFRIHGDAVLGTLLYQNHDWVRQLKINGQLAIQQRVLDYEYAMRRRIGTRHVAQGELEDFDDRCQIQASIDFRISAEYEAVMPYFRSLLNDELQASHDDFVELNEERRNSTGAGAQEPYAHFRPAAPVGMLFRGQKVILYQRSNDDDPLVTLELPLCVAFTQDGDVRVVEEAFPNWMGEPIDLNGILFSSNQSFSTEAEIRGENIEISDEVAVVMFFREAFNRLKVLSGCEARSCTVAIPGNLSCGRKTVIRETLLQAGLFHVSLVPVTTLLLLNIARERARMEVERRGLLEWERLLSMYYDGSYLEAACSILTSDSLHVEPVRWDRAAMVDQRPADRVRLLIKDVIEERTLTRPAPRIPAAAMIATTGGSYSVRLFISMGREDVGFQPPPLFVTEAQMASVLTDLDSELHGPFPTPAERFPKLLPVVPLQLELPPEATGPRVVGQKTIYEFEVKLGSDFVIGEMDHADHVVHQYKFTVVSLLEKPTRPNDKVKIVVKVTPDGAFRVSPWDVESNVRITGMDCKLMSLSDRRDIRRDVDRLGSILQRRPANQRME